MAGRTDNVTDPGVRGDLLVARRGQAFFARMLNGLRDVDFAGPSLIPGVSRVRLIAHVGYHARAFVRVVEGARRDESVLLYESPQRRTEEESLGATLPTEALRNLVAHAAVHLNVEWRDLPEPAWTRRVPLSDVDVGPVSRTVALRAEELWWHAIDLGNGALPSDIPADLRDRPFSHRSCSLLQEAH
jgi:maleylpyruvate isomerase